MSCPGFDVVADGFDVVVDGFVVVAECFDVVAEYLDMVAECFNLFLGKPSQRLCLGRSVWGYLRLCSSEGSGPFMDEGACGRPAWVKELMGAFRGEGELGHPGCLG